MLSCKACKSKDSHISSLKEEVVHLRSLIYPVQVMSTEPEENRKIDAMLTGADIVSDAPTLTESKEDEVTRERDYILSGNYDQ